MTNIGKGERLMWLRIGTFLGFSVWLVLATANDARAQDVLWVPRSQLFAAVLGQEIGQTLAHVMNAYALGKARKEELEALRSQIAKCGDNCSDATENPCVGGSIPPWAPLISWTFFASKSPKTALCHIATPRNRKRAFRQFAMASGDSVQYACARTLHSGGAPSSA
jgi:hypothetical protein